ncbi:ferroxidase fet3, partial [Coemansia helicoidea]
PVPRSALVGNVGGRNTKTLAFSPGKTYRLRLINMSALAMFHFSIDGHTMRVIEVDGIDTEPMEVGNVRLAAAQRVSVLVTALDSADANYVFHADMDTDMFDNTPPELNYNSTGLIEYRAGADVHPTGDVDWSPFNDIELVPLVKAPALRADVSHTLDVHFGQYTDTFNHGTFNNISYVAPRVPVMFTALSMGADAMNPAVYGRQTNARVLEHMSVVELVVNNYDAGNHPFHLHGHTFQIIERGSVPHDPSAPAPAPVDSPIHRDTVMIPSEEYVVLRFRADNPGVWLFHCHIEWHIESGLNMALIEAPDVMQQRIHVPQQIVDHCRAAGIPTEGNAAGRAGLDLTGAPVGPHPYPMGWTAKAKGAMAGCILAALVGLVAIVWYGWSSKRSYRPVPTADKAGDPPSDETSLEAKP